jgi:hypothetical protein
MAEQGDRVFYYRNGDSVDPGTGQPELTRSAALFAGQNQDGADEIFVFWAPGAGPGGTQRLAAAFSETPAHECWSTL